MKKVGEGQPTEEITKQPVDKIVEFGGEKIPQGHKDIFDPNLPTDQTEKSTRQTRNQESRHRKSD